MKISILLCLFFLSATCLAQMHPDSITYKPSKTLDFSFQIASGSYQPANRGANAGTIASNFMGVNSDGIGAGMGCVIKVGYSIPIRNLLFFQPAIQFNRVVTHQRIKNFPTIDARDQFVYSEMKSPFARNFIGLQAGFKYQSSFKKRFLVASFGASLDYNFRNVIYDWSFFGSSGYGPTIEPYYSTRQVPIRRLISLGGFLAIGYGFRTWNNTEINIMPTFNIVAEPMLSAKYSQFANPRNLGLNFTFLIPFSTPRK